MITYWVPIDQFDLYLHPPLDLTPTDTFYALRQQLPGNMITYVDERPGYVPA